MLKTIKYVIENGRLVNLKLLIRTKFDAIIEQLGLAKFMIQI